MNSRERVLEATNHRSADRLPITFDCEPEVFAKLCEHLGTTDRDEVWDSLHVDTRLIGADHNDSRCRSEHDINYDFWGIGQKRFTHAHGSYSTQVAQPLSALDAIDELLEYDWPTADELSFETLRTSRKMHPDKAIIAHITHAAFFKCTQLRGMEKFLIDMALNPEYVELMLNKVNDYLYPAIERLCTEAGDTFDIFYIADDTCTSMGPMMSQAMFERWILPYMRTYADICHAHGKKLLLHTCGSVRPFLPALIEAGVDILEPIQTTAKGMSETSLKRDFGRDITFYGAIDTINLLPNSAPSDVRLAVLDMFQTLGKDGGYIIGPSHTYMQNDVPLDNILEMYRVAFDECRYPL